jgi:hypothetical protein
VAVRIDWAQDMLAAMNGDRSGRRQMNKLFCSVLLGAAVAFSAVAAQAMPLIPDQAPSGMITKVEGGCGVGWHRGPYGHCRRDGYYGGPVVVAPRVYYNGPAYYAGGPCGGRGQHRVCGVNGGCVMVCN